MFRLKNVLGKQALEPSLVGIGNLIAAVIGGIFWLILASIVPIQDYGQLNYFISLSTMLSIGSLLGLNLTVMTYLPKGDEALKRHANIIVLISNTLIAIPLLALTQNYAVVLLLIGTSLFTMTIAQVLGRKRYSTFPILVIGERVLQFGLSIGLYFVLGIDGILLGYGLSLLVFSYIFFKEIRINKNPMPVGSTLQPGIGFVKPPSLYAIRSKWKFVVHAYLTSLAQSLSLYVDKLMIAPLFGFYTLGLYQLGFQFLLLLSVIPVSLSQYLLPQESSGVQSKKVQKVGLLFAVIVALLSYLLIEHVISALFPHYRDSIPAARIMVFAVIPMTVNAISNARLLGSERSKPVLIGAGVFFSSLLSLIFILGNAFQLVGLAVALVLALSIQATVLVALSRGNQKQHK